LGAYASWVALRWRKRNAIRNLPRNGLRLLARIASKVLRLLSRIASKVLRLLSRIASKVLRLLSRLLWGKSNTTTTIKETNDILSQHCWTYRASFLEAAIENTKKKHLTKNTKPNHIVHLIGSLQAGGAERQMCNCVIGAHRLGYEVTVLLLFKPTGEHEHYSELLAKEGIKVRVAGEFFNPRFKSELKKIPGGEASLTVIPEEFCPFAIDVLGELLSDPPDVLHAWLDHPNIWGGVAALFANIPLIVLSTRNVNPTHFPYLASPYFHAMYKQFAQSPNVKFINNSHAGADDYAKWLNMPKEAFKVVLNGVDFSCLSRPANQDITNFINDLGIPEDGKIIAGVFRLSDEKQPFIFLEVVRRIIKRNDNVYAVIAGIGPLQQELERFIITHNLGERIFYLGRRTDVSTIYSAATLKLLCSLQEGTPNVLLESQWLGCPVVSTKAGGAVDAVSHGETGLLVDVGDISGLENAVLLLIDNPESRASMARAGPAFIQNRFGMDRMVCETIAIYNEMEVQ
jgi:glycosyltransferase involved in cell wall biosynthesis